MRKRPICRAKTSDIPISCSIQFNLNNYIASSASAKLPGAGEEKQQGQAPRYGAQNDAEYAELADWAKLCGDAYAELREEAQNQGPQNIYYGPEVREKIDPEIQPIALSVLQIQEPQVEIVQQPPQEAAVVPQIWQGWPPYEGELWLGGDY